MGLRLRSIISAVLSAAVAASTVVVVEMHLQTLDRNRIARCEAIKEQYDEYNKEYFGDKLPKNTRVTYYHGKYVARTGMDKDGVPHIYLDDVYNAPPQFMHAVLGHEMCHIATWPEQAEHGSQWDSCMLNLTAQHFYERVFIFSYGEPE
jgi:hypothetical protein